jgi:hypothetical protein
MKIVTAHQPAYLPWMGLIHKIALSDVYVFLDNVQFQKNSFINRNKIKSTNGPFWLTLPVKSKGHINTSMDHLKINNNLNWRAKHWKSFQNNYNKAPFFADISDFLEEIYAKDWVYLKDITEVMLKWLLSNLKINVEFVRGRELKLKEKKSDLILELTNKLGGNCFVFGKLGENYADKESFRKNQIKIYSQDFHHPVYPQLYGKFVPFLNVFDLIANVGLKNAKSYVMKGNITKQDLKSDFYVG